jgi:hypothetical protein
MIVALIAVSVVAPPKTLNILFLGNSHTASHNLPKMVESLLESSDPGLNVSTKHHAAGFVEELANSHALNLDIKSKQFHVLVMQGAKLSSSHKYDYDHSGAVKISKFARQNGLKTLLFAEWPRRGWNETPYIMKEYREIASPSGATIVPIPESWDVLLAKVPKADLWEQDGNHSNLNGAFFAACSIAAWIQPAPARIPKWRPTGVESSLAAMMKAIVQQIRNRSLDPKRG